MHASRTKWSLASQERPRLGVFLRFGQRPRSGQRNFVESVGVEKAEKQNGSESPSNHFDGDWPTVVACWFMTPQAMRLPALPAGSLV